jgi:hypothetical protein
MGSFQKDINYQASLAALVVAGTPLINQVAYDVTLQTSAGLYIGTSGTLNVVMAADPNDTVVSFSNVVAGTFLPIQVKKVLSTSTCGNIMVFLLSNPTSVPGLLWEQALFNWELAFINWN